MSVYFRTETLYYNAFYAVQEKTSFLSDEDILVFCNLLKKHIEERVDFGRGNCNVVFDLRENEKSPFGSETDCFTRLGDSIVYYGKPIEKDDLDFINCCFGSSEVAKSLSDARNSFARLLESSENILNSRNHDIATSNLVVV